MTETLQEGKIKGFSQVNLFPCIIIPINKLFYSYSTTDISVEFLKKKVTSYII